MKSQVVLFVLVSFTILALADVFHPREPLTDRSLQEGAVKPIEKRQRDCDVQCSSLEPALACNTSTCVCPVLNAAGSSAITTCTNCLETVPEFSMYASFLPLLGEVCSMCATPCSSLLTAILVQVPSCSGTPLACACSILRSIGSAALQSCTSCVQTFDPSDVSGVLSLENQCHISVSGNSSATTSASTSQFYSSVFSNASQTVTVTPTAGSAQVTPATTQPPTSVSTISHSSSQKSITGLSGVMILGLIMVHTLVAWLVDFL